MKVTVINDIYPSAVVTPTAPAATPVGNLAQLNLDASGNLKCSVTGAGSGGTSSVDEAGFSAGVSVLKRLLGQDGLRHIILSFHLPLGQTMRLATML